MKCFVCKRVIVEHDDNRAELTMTTFRGVEQFGSFTMTTCNDPLCVKTACEGLGLAVIRSGGTP